MENSSAGTTNSYRCLNDDAANYSRWSRVKELTELKILSKLVHFHLFMLSQAAVENGHHSDPDKGRLARVRFEELLLNSCINSVTVAVLNQLPLWKMYTYRYSCTVSS
jgi:hypothetical protein